MKEGAFLMKNITTRKLVEAALMIAIATVLSLFKIDLPFGGGVTIVSMLPLVIHSHRYGVKWGVFTAFVYSIFQLLLGMDNVSYASNIIGAVVIILFDYIIAYTVIGLASLFGKDSKGIVLGILFAFFLRFLCHYITGVFIWGGWMPETFMNLPMTSPWIYSLLYNGWYMLVETILTILVALLLNKTAGQRIFNVK